MATKTAKTTKKKTTKKKTTKKTSKASKTTAASKPNKNLVIVESPAKAKTIGKYLGRKYKVMASVGHVIDLPKSKLGVDVENGFEPEYVTIKGKAKILKDLAKEAKGAEEILLATDPDREGEAIAWHIANYLKENARDKRKKVETNGGPEIHRIVFNEITKSAIQRALEAKGAINSPMVDAQQARRILDRLVGYLVSPKLWSIFYKGLSAGRVQSVALRLICEREAEIEAFVPEEYWTIESMLRTGAGETFPAQVARKDDKKIELKDEKSAKAAVAAIQKEALQVANVTQRDRQRAPQPPFITSTMQMDAARRMSFTSKKTMMLAQQLYERGLITYMRTDSVRIADEARAMVETTIKDTYGEKYLPEKPREFKISKKAQDAHEAIRPTDMTKTPEMVEKLPGGDDEKLTRDQHRLYDLIWRRTAASLMANATSKATSVDVQAGAYTLRATGSVPTFDGWLAALPDPGTKKDTVLPDLKEGQKLDLESIEPIQHFTQPPPRFRDSSLVKELEARGIGRPSTYASIIGTLIDRKYMERQSGAFHPTLLGREVWKVLEASLPDVFEVTFTAAMEEELDKVETGEEPWRVVVDHFYGPLSRQLEELESKKEGLRESLMEGTEEECARCGKNLIIRWGSNGRFLACPGYPDCRYTKGLEDDEMVLDENCPECSKQLKVKTGRYGRFVACTGYPDCRFTKPLATGVKCPKDQGDIVEKRSRRGKVFYSCGNYPECEYALWNKPVNRPCDACKHPFMTEKYTQAKGSFLLCPECKHEDLE